MSDDAAVESIQPLKWSKIDVGRDWRAMLQYARKQLKNPELRDIGEYPNKIERMLIHLTTLGGAIGYKGHFNHKRGEEFWGLRNNNGAIYGSFFVMPYQHAKSPIRGALLEGFYISPEKRNEHGFRELIEMLNNYCALNKINEIRFVAHRDNKAIVEFYRTIAAEYEPAKRRRKDKNHYFVLRLNHSEDSKTALSDAVRNFRKGVRKVAL